MISLNADLKKIRTIALTGPFFYLPWYWAMQYLYPGSWNPFSLRFGLCVIMLAVGVYTFYRPHEDKKHVLMCEGIFYLMMLHHFVMAYENSDLIVYRYTFFLVTVMCGAMMMSMRSYIILVAAALVCKAIMFTKVQTDLKFEIFEFFLWFCQFYIIGWLIRSIFQGRIEIFQLSEKTTQAAIAIEIAKASVIDADKKLLEKDLEVVGGVQTLLLPKFNKMSSGPIEVCSFFQPASRAGGDWWWFAETTDGRSRFFMGDVTGHGAGSAMVTALLAGCYQTAVDFVHDAPMEELLDVLNRRLQESCGQTHWVTFSALELDPAKKKIDFFSMASPEIIVSSKMKTEIIRGDELSSPLGSGQLKYTKISKNFHPGDQILIFTDGLYEFVDKSQKQYGMRNLQKLFADSLSIGAIDEQVQYLSVKTQEARLDFEIEDDITFAVVRFNENPKSLDLVS